MLNIISFCIIFQHIGFYNQDIERILRLDAGEATILLCDLASVIGYEDSVYAPRLRIFHASLADYPLDSARSKEYFIDATRCCADRVTDCFQFLSCAPLIPSDCISVLLLTSPLSAIDAQSQDPLYQTVQTAMSCFRHTCDSLDLAEPLYNAIRQFSLSRIYNLALNMKPADDSLRSQRHSVFCRPFSPSPASICHRLVQRRWQWRGLHKPRLPVATREFIYDRQWPSRQQASTSPRRALSRQEIGRAHV